MLLKVAGHTDSSNFMTLVNVKSTIHVSIAHDVVTVQCWDATVHVYVYIYTYTHMEGAASTQLNTPAPPTLYHHRQGVVSWVHVETRGAVEEKHPFVIHEETIDFHGGERRPDKGGSGGGSSVWGAQRGGQTIGVVTEYWCKRLDCRLDTKLHVSHAAGRGPIFMSGPDGPAVTQETVCRSEQTNVLCQTYNDIHKNKDKQMWKLNHFVLMFVLNSRIESCFVLFNMLFWFVTKWKWQFNFYSMLFLFRFFFHCFKRKLHFVLNVPVGVCVIQRFIGIYA